MAIARDLNDDRVVAALIALWFANEWIIGAEPTEPPVGQTRLSRSGNSGYVSRGYGRCVGVAVRGASGITIDNILMKRGNYFQ